MLIKCGSCLVVACTVRKLFGDCMYSVEVVWWPCAVLKLSGGCMYSVEVLYCCILYVTSKHKVKTSWGCAEALKHVGILIKYFKNYVCAFVGMNNKQYKRLGMCIKIHSLYLITFFRKSCGLWDNVEICCRTGATDDNMAHAHCMMDTLVYKQTLRICNNYCFYTATMICTNAPQCYVIHTLSWITLK